MGTMVITDRGTIPATDTMVITVEGATMDIGGRSGQACSLISYIYWRVESLGVNTTRTN
jgi:hypothetical protein